MLSDLSNSGFPNLIFSKDFQPPWKHPKPTYDVFDATCKQQNYKNPIWLHKIFYIVKRTNRFQCVLYYRCWLGSVDYKPEIPLVLRSAYSHRWKSYPKKTEYYYKTNSYFNYIDPLSKFQKNRIRSSSFPWNRLKSFNSHIEFESIIYKITQIEYNLIHGSTI